MAESVRDDGIGSLKMSRAVVIPTGQQALYTCFAL